MQRLIRAALPLVLLLATVAAIIAPIRYWDNGLIEIESTQFVRQYLDGRSTLQKIFDPHGNDLGTYQARELSYFADYLDARVLDLFMRADRPFFVPASAIAASALTLLVCAVAIGRFPPAVRVPAGLVLLVYVTNYAHVVTMGMLYRSSKPLLAPVLMATAFYLVAVQRRPAAANDGTSVLNRSAPLVVFALLCAMSLLDRQGFFYAVAATAAVAVHAVVFGGRRDVLVGCAAAVAVMVAYNLLIAPLLVERINGYSPSFEYQRVPWKSIFQDHQIFAQAGTLVLQAVALLAGGLPTWVVGMLMAAASVWLLVRRRLRLALACFLVVAMQIVLSALMIARHPPIYVSYDHRVWYYPLPFQALLVALLICLIGRVAPRWNSLRVATISLALAALVVANVLSWNDYRRAQLRSLWFPRVYMQNLALKASFEDGRPRPAMSPEYLAFYEFWRARVPALRERLKGPSPIAREPDDCVYFFPIAYRFFSVRRNNCPWDTAIVLSVYSSVGFSASSSNFGPAANTDVTPSSLVT